MVATESVSLRWNQNHFQNQPCQHWMISDLCNHFVYSVTQSIRFDPTNRVIWNGTNLVEFAKHWKLEEHKALGCIRHNCYLPHISLLNSTTIGRNQMFVRYFRILRGEWRVYKAGRSVWPNGDCQPMFRARECVVGLASHLLSALESR